MVQLKQFDKYQILRKLGRSMTDVYLAFDPAANRRVVLKLVEQARDEFTQIVIEAERRGAQIQRQLHEIDPRILEIYDFGESNGCFFVAMEHFEGRDIAQILQTERRLTPQRAARYAIEVLNQLDRLHSFVSDVDGRSRAVVHGDIKPSNIQIGAGDRLRLLDFGIAKMITSTRNLTRHNLGSPTYCSPERLANGQVDAQADLWALGVSLYEMVAGSLPYQAQSTRRLENLIRSRKPPRALPADCPARLRAILAKALAADIGRRYPSASAFETDLRAFVESRATIAENQVQPSWDANETIQKAPPGAATRRQRLMDHISDARLAVPALRRRFANEVWSIGAGVLLGLFLVAPLSYSYNVHRASRSILAADFTRLNAAAITADWNLFKKLERENNFLGGFSPMTGVAGTLHAKLMAAADAVIEHYRNSSDSSLADFDWTKARLCLSYARQLDGNDREAHGKLALCDGYLNLIENPQLPKADLSETDFAIAAADLPRSPDPHLGLARLYTYAFRNAGKAKSEFTEAERRGFRAGPRELKQEADAYLFRAEWELRQAQRETASSKTTPSKTPSSRKDETRWLRQASNDLDRARGIYEPIVGFADVSDALDQLYEDRGSADQLRAQLDPPPQPKPKPKRPARRRTMASVIHAGH
ncbi:MAG TPA: serine/threonine-protein kinase [Bryobacteraceae bacterium]|nr:serine/threonine-protein kinase [Bryobacteraceae bacterium]